VKRQSFKTYDIAALVPNQDLIWLPPLRACSLFLQCDATFVGATIFHMLEMNTGERALLPTLTVSSGAVARPQQVYNTQNDYVFSRRVFQLQTMPAGATGTLKLWLYHHGVQDELDGVYAR